MSKYERRTGRYQTEEEAEKYGRCGEQVIYLHSVPEKFLNELEEMGLWYSDPMPCYGFGVWIHKPIWTKGNNISGYEPSGIIRLKSFDDEEFKEQPESDAPALKLARWNEGWFVDGVDHCGGMGPGDFLNEWDTGVEALADIKDFYFGDPARMAMKAAAITGGKL